MTTGRGKSEGLAAAGAAFSWLWPTSKVILGATLCACQPPPETPREPTRVAAPVEISPPCNLYVGDVGDDRDPSLLGSPRTDAPRCCEDLGFDAKLAAQSCGFREYLGESEELACVHRYLDDSGQLTQLRLTPVVGLDFAGAVELHQSGPLGEARADPASLPPGLWLAGGETGQWALVSGWPTPRRLSWDPRSCSAEAMGPVLDAMLDAPAPAQPPAALPRLELAVDRLPANNEGLLQRFAEATARAPPYLLPRDANALVDALMIAAQHDDLDGLGDTLSSAARWGLPDRRQIAGRPVLDALVDGAGPTFMAALRQAASRLPADAQLHCPSLDRRVVAQVRHGEALMWCVWTDASRLDLLVFGLRGVVSEGVADGRVEYIGLFPEAPHQALRMPGEPPPPPPRPRPSIVCGDPHAVDYPGLCAKPEPPDDDEGDDDGDELESTIQDR